MYSLLILETSSNQPYCCLVKGERRKTVFRFFTPRYESEYEMRDHAEYLEEILNSDIRGFKKVLIQSIAEYAVREAKERIRLVDQTAIKIEKLRRNA